MSEKIFKVSGEEFRKQYKEAYESGRASLADKMPAEFFARTAISDEVAVLLFRYMSFLDEADKTTCRFLQEVKKLIENGKFQHLKECEGLNPQVIDMIDTLYEKRLRECCDELLCIAMTMYRIFNMQERPLQRPEYKRRTEMAWRAVNKARKDKLIELSERKKSLKESPADNIPLAVKVKEQYDSSGMRGQEEAKKIVAMSKHKFVISEGKDRNPILLEGPTGSGKTFMFQLLEEMPRVRAELGYPPLVTPTSQIVGSMSVLNVALGRYKMIPREVKDIILGKYGSTPGPIKPKVKRLTIGDEPQLDPRPADDTPPQIKKPREKLAEEGFPNAPIEDGLSYASFPEVTLNFLRHSNIGMKFHDL